jgi:acetolactate synthase-1/2/3 large subunit
MNVGEQVLATLKAHGVSTIFGVPGEQGIALYDAVRRDPSVRHIGMRDERNLPYAALAYARVAGRSAALDVTVGPGTAMLPVGLLEARHSATPLVVLASDVPVELDPYAYQGALSQGMDQWEFLGGLTKWRGKAWRPEHVPTLLRRAFQEATTGTPGPTAVIIPQDVYNSDAVGAPAAGESSYPAVRTLPTAGDVAAAARLLAGARRPLLVAGGGVLHSGAGQQFVALARALGAATATTLTGVGSVPDDYPYHVGLLGGIGTEAAEAIAREADVVLLVGFRSGGNSTFYWQFPSGDQRVVHLDIEPTAPGRYLRCDVRLVGDARETLTMLAEAGGYQPNQEWTGRAAAAHSEWLAARAREEASAERPVAPQRVLAELSGVLGPQDIVVADASFSSGWVALHTRVVEPGRRVILPRGMAGLGFGLPGGIGAKAAAPERDVWVVAGDGGYGYSLGELITLLDHGLKVNSLVLNNRSWGWMDWGSKLRYGTEYFPLPDVSYAAVAASLGLYSARVEDPDDLGEALRAAAADERPAVVEVVSALWESPLLAHRRALRPALAEAGSAA